MRFEKSLVCALTIGIGAGSASAQDYGDHRNADELFKPGAAVSVSIAGFAGGSWRTLSTEPDASVPRSSFDDPMFVDVGHVQVDSGAQDTVEAAWWYQQVGGSDYIRLTVRTQNGADFVPFASKKGGSLIQAYTYEMGANGDGIDFRNWVTNLDWQDLTISYSYDGGQTVFSDPTIHDPIGESNWDGTDALHLGLALPGDGINWIQATYKFVAIPAPSSLAALLGAGALAARRRRS